MPGPITHQLFYKQLKNQLNRKTLDSMPGYEKYSIFAQGHDLFLYHNFYKIFSAKRLIKNVQNSDLLQEYFFQEFVYNYLKHAQDLNFLDREQILLFLGPGYIAHHILDAYTHPFIIYLAGDHVRDRNNSTWMHGIIENYLDIFMMEQAGMTDVQDTQIYKMFSFTIKDIDPALPDVLDASLNETYGFKDGGKVICCALSQVSLFMHIFKYDPSGLKRIIFDFLDPFLKGTSSFSYHRSVADSRRFLNEEHEQWCNPMNDTLCSRESFIELYRKALSESAMIIENLMELCRTGDITQKNVFDVVPDIASTHGLSCGKTIEIKYSKQLCQNRREQNG